MAKQKSLIPIIPTSRLAEDVRMAITDMKNTLRNGLPPQPPHFSELAESASESR
jgi:hypothetical protein